MREKGRKKKYRKGIAFLLTMVLVVGLALLPEVSASAGYFDFLDGSIPQSGATNPPSESSEEAGQPQSEVGQEVYIEPKTGEPVKLKKAFLNLLDQLKDMRRRQWKKDNSGLPVSEMPDDYILGNLYPGNIHATTNYLDGVPYTILKDFVDLKADLVLEEQDPVTKRTVTYTIYWETLEQLLEEYKEEAQGYVISGAVLRKIESVIVTDSEEIRLDMPLADGYALLGEI